MASGVWRALDGRTRLDQHAAPEQSGRHELALCLRAGASVHRHDVIVNQGYSQQFGGWGKPPEVL
eukprot:5689055-Prymnesium_polylepis.1